MSDDAPLQITLDAGVLSLTVQRARRRNAYDLAVYAALADALRDAAGDTAVRAVVLRGDGEHFCAGNNIADFVAHPPTSKDHVIFRFLETIVGFGKPIVAAVDGAAVGIGTTVLLHCDIAIATPRARFQVPFTQLGLVPEAASSVALAWAVGRHRASRWLLLGEAFSGEQALAAGLVTELVAPEQLEARASELAKRLAALPPAAVQGTKALLAAPVRDATLAAMAREAEVFVERLASDEAKAAFAAFLSRGR